MSELTSRYAVGSFERLNDQDEWWSSDFAQIVSPSSSSPRELPNEIVVVPVNQGWTAPYVPYAAMHLTGQARSYGTIDAGSILYGPTSGMTDLGGPYLGSLPKQGLSEDFIRRLMTFVSWSPDWDGQGADVISVDTAMRALTLARDVLPSAPEPFVAPSADGSLLLQWELATNLSIEVFVEAEERWETVVVVHGDRVLEVPVANRAQTIALIRRHSGRPIATFIAR